MLKAGWLAWGVELALVLCMAPALLLSRLSFEYEAGLRLRDSQLWLFASDAKRHWAVEHAIEQTPGLGKDGKQPKTREKLLAAVGLFGTHSEPLYYYGTHISSISLFRD